MALRQMAPASAAAIPFLIQALRDLALDVRLEAARALQRLGPAARDSVPVFIEWLGTKSEEEIRDCAAESLGKVGSESPDAIQALGMALIDKEEKVRYRAAVGLGASGSMSDSPAGMQSMGLSAQHSIAAFREFQVIKDNANRPTRDGGYTHFANHSHASACIWSLNSCGAS
jgi:HEAT repeat protein